MADFVQLPVESVTQHASAVEGVTDAVRSARAAVSSVTMDPGAYGLLCGFLPGVLSGVFEVAVVAMNGSADALEETALNLRAAVRTIESTDSAAAATLLSR
ncbi:hypothetical protein ACTI_83550 [Actinoplanes sp. OR16]|uniref:type VII secretion target n=1 Tax=Actinoplanes sp. OR16 TaxID=946334 RepID=UPI000F6DF40B|nr:hypothetical protein [Actinoplanes sp. OR16]BBH71670.1 hypothetical protein ACTI_83550 [Actinoplanes sp. OR16]